MIASSMAGRLFRDDQHVLGVEALSLGR